MASVAVNTATQSSSAAIATNLITRDSGTIEQMQMINVVDPSSGVGASVSSGGALTVASAPASPIVTNGSITSATSSVTITTTSEPSVTVSIHGTYAGVNISFLGSDDATNYYPIAMTRSDSTAYETTSGVLSSTLRAWNANVVGFTSFRVLATAWTSGTAVINISAVALSTEPNPVVSIPSTVTTTYSGTQAVTVTSGTINLGTTNGIASTLYTNSTLAAATNSATATLNFCENVTLFYTATAASTGTVTIYGSSDNVTFFTLTTTIAQTASAFTSVLSVIPCRYYYIKSTVALTALYLQFQGTY